MKKALFPIKILLTFVIWILAFVIFPSEARGEVCDQYQCDPISDNYIQCNSDKQKCLEDVIKETQNKANTLKNTISIVNGQIQVQQLQINQTVVEIENLEKEIGELGTRIDGLEISLDRMSNLLIERVNATYKQRQANPFLLMLTSDSLGDFLTQMK